MKKTEWNIYLTSNRNVIGVGATEDGKLHYFAMMRRWQTDPKKFRFFLNDKISNLGELKALTKRLELTKKCECSLEEVKMEATKILMKKPKMNKKAFKKHTL